MGLIAVPNVSEGRDIGRIRGFEAVLSSAGTKVGDVHRDEVHNRSVFTVGGATEDLIVAMTRLAAAASSIDLTQHTGVHPRLGGLDVCPVVPHGSPMSDAVSCALAIGESIGSDVGIPVFLFGAAARREETRELPDLRRGGLSELRRRVDGGLLAPDFGPVAIDEKVGVVCVGARDVLIAFNVWIEASGEVARSIASEVREARSGLVGLRALGLQIDARRSQVSMNLTDPSATGIDTAYEAVSAAAKARGVRVDGTELIGVPPERFLPDPEREAARLLRRPGRSLESALA